MSTHALIILLITTNRAIFSAQRRFYVQSNNKGLIKSEDLPSSLYACGLCIGHTHPHLCHCYPCNYKRPKMQLAGHTHTSAAAAAAKNLNTLCMLSIIFTHVTMEFHLISMQLFNPENLRNFLQFSYILSFQLFKSIILFVGITIAFVCIFPAVFRWLCRFFFKCENVRNEVNWRRRRGFPSRNLQPRFRKPHRCC